MKSGWRLISNSNLNSFPIKEKHPFLKNLLYPEGGKEEPMDRIGLKSFLYYVVRSQAIKDDFPCAPMTANWKDGKKKTIWDSVVQSMTAFPCILMKSWAVRMSCIRLLPHMRYFCFGKDVNKPFFLCFFVAAVINGYLELGFLGSSLLTGDGSGLGSGLTEIGKQKRMRKWVGHLKGWSLQQEMGWVI